MLIKKVTVNRTHEQNTYSELRILFYDQDGNLFESGDVISNNTSDGETENFKLTYDGGPAYSPEYYPIYAVLTTSYKGIGENSGYRYFSSAGGSSGLFTIEFKTIQPISKIQICTNLSSTKKRFLFRYI